MDFTVQTTAADDMTPAEVLAETEHELKLMKARQSGDGLSRIDNRGVEAQMEAQMVTLKGYVAGGNVWPDWYGEA